MGLTFVDKMGKEISEGDILASELYDNLVAKINRITPKRIYLHLWGGTTKVDLSIDEFLQSYWIKKEN